MKPKDNQIAPQNAISPPLAAFPSVPAPNASLTPPDDPRVGKAAQLVTVSTVRCLGFRDVIRLSSAHPSLAKESALRFRRRQRPKWGLFPPEVRSSGGPQPPVGKTTARPPVPLSLSLSLQRQTQDSGHRPVGPSVLPLSIVFPLISLSSNRSLLPLALTHQVFPFRTSGSHFRSPKASPFSTIS
jgi:hypothetical protein